MQSTLARFTSGLVLLTASVVAQGPLVLMGIDAEDGGVGGHGPLAVYASIISNGGGTGVLDNVTNGGSNILVIGGGKIAGDNVTTFWNAIDVALPGATVTYVNGPAIAAQSFAGFAMIAIVSDQFNTPSGGLTNAEMALLAGRAGDIANFVNGGGGLLGFSSNDLATPYAYLGLIGAFTFNSPPQFQDITPTLAGLAIGVTNALDICCWHDEYLTFPAFLDVLATNVATGNPCAIGGQRVIIVQGIALTPGQADRCIGDNHTLTASVADNLGNPVAGAAVTFQVIAGPNTGVNGAGVTNLAGETTFTYTSLVPGTDTIQACFTDNNNVLRCANATVTWQPLPTFDPQSPCGQTLMASVGVPISYMISATANTNLAGNQITLDAVGVPPGATHAPALPLVVAGPGATATTTFSWTPTNANVGNYLVTYTATDNCGQRVTCQVRLEVAECFLLVGLSPMAFRLGNDTLLVEPLFVLPMTLTALPSLRLPANNSLIGVSVYTQSLLHNPSIFANDPLRLSQAIRFNIGVANVMYGQGSGLDMWSLNPSPVQPGGQIQIGFAIR